MRFPTRRILTTLAIISMGTCASFLDGCIAQYQMEAEVLAEPMANPTLIYDSKLVDLFGAEAIKFFQKWW